MEDHEVLHYPASRVATFDVGRIALRKHRVVGLLELDVTVARARIKEAIKAGRDLGFSSWLIKTISSTIVANPYIHAINQRRGRQVVFKDVDISLPLERKVEGRSVPLVTVIRKTNAKTVDEIAREIRAAATREVRTERDFVLEGKASTITGLFFRMPRFLRALVWRYLLSNPFRRKERMGTVMVTTVATAGRYSGWILPASIHNLAFGIGSIIKKPWVCGGRMEIREILNLSILIDHDVVDGNPAAHFMDALARNIEGALGL